MDLKQKIIHESLRLFSLKGFLSTSMNDILEAAGTSKGGFYNHFNSKEDLFFAVLEEAKTLWRAKTLWGLDQLEQPVARVKGLLKNYRDRYLKDSENLPGGCVFVTLAVELADQKPHLAQALNEGFVRLKAMINRLLEQGKKSGELRDDVNTENTTELIFAGMLGASTIYGIEKSYDSLDRAIDCLIDYLDSLSPEPMIHTKK